MRGAPCAEGTPGSLHGEAVVRVGRGRGGRLRIDEVRSTALLAVRPTDDAVYLVGGAATPLGGDRASLVVEVGAGATLCIRSVAAAVARPGPGAREARFAVRAVLGPGAALWWEPEPGVPADGCVMSAEAVVDMAPDSRLRWREEVVVGRCGERPGTWSSSLHVDRDGRPVLRHQVVVGDGCGPAVAGRRRAVGSLLVVGGAPPQRVVRHGPAYAAAMPLAVGDATLVTAVAPDHPALRRIVDDVVSGEPATARPAAV